MSMREAINKNPTVSVVILFVTVTLCVGFAIRSAASNANEGIPTKFYYSDDDGVTFFADEATKVAPFDHNGKQAVKAYVYRFGSKSPFVGYLERVTPEGHKKISALNAAQPNFADKAVEIASQNNEIKKPGGKDWVRLNTLAGSKVVGMQAPANETGELEPVFP